MTRKPDPFGPFETPEELARGRRRAAINLLVAAVASCLAVVAHRTVGDARLVQTYLLAGALFLAAGIGALVRLSRTGEFEKID